jgi:hypothetical protein
MANVCVVPGINCTANAVDFLHADLLDDGVFWSCLSDRSRSCADVANEDINGLGTLIAFLVTALLTFLIAWVILIFDVNIAERQSRSPHANSHDESILDHRFRAFLHFTIGRRSTYLQLSDRWCHVLQRLVIAFSDGHLVTGLAILVAAYSQSRTITIYHFVSSSTTQTW